MDYRVGSGFDVHRFLEKEQPGKPLVLGGTVIEYPFSLDAVSDGDVVIHAVCDALCGAAGLGDIGDLFPPDDERSRDISGRAIAAAVLEKAGQRYSIVNMDITLIAEKPRLAMYKKEMTSSLQKIFAVEAVNIKIKSKEGLDILGGVEAIACTATVLIREK